MYEQREKNDANNDVNVQKPWEKKTNLSIMNVNKVDHPREIGPSSPEKDPTDEEVVSSSPKKELTDEEVGSSSLEEVGSSSLKEELADKVVPSSPKKELTDKEVVPFSPKIEPTEEEVVPSSPKKELTHEEVVSSSPKIELTEEEVVLSSPKKELTHEEVVSSSPKKEPPDKEIGPSSPKKEPPDKEIGPSSPKKEPPDKEIGPSSPKIELTEEEVVSSSPKIELTEEEVVPSSPKKELTEEEVVSSSPKIELTEEEVVSSSPKIELTVEEIGPSSLKKNPTYKKVGPCSSKKGPPDKETDPSPSKKEPIDKETGPSSPEKEPTDNEIGSSSPERVPTYKVIVSLSLKRVFTDKETVLKLILQFFSERVPNDQSSSSPKKVTDALSLSEIKTPERNRASSWLNNGLTYRKPAPLFMNTLHYFIWIQLVLVMFSPVSMATNDGSVNIFTSMNVGVPDDNFAFFCYDLSRTASSVQWLVNGTLLENSTLMNVYHEFNTRSKSAELYFDLPLEHNVTTIQCIYNFASEDVSSETITVLLQGLLDAVGSLSVDLVDTNISLTWTAPFTLDISKVDPDITYCVDVVNSTSSSTVLSECGIIETSFSFPIGRVCDNLNYTFTVTPVNRAGNGTAVTLGYSQDITAPIAIEVSLLPVIDVHLDTQGVPTSYQINMSDLVCYGELKFMDEDTGEIIIVVGSISRNIITFTTERLKTNRLYDMSVKASNINGSALSNFNFSTHDIRDATVDNTSRLLTTEYFEYSKAKGALVIIICMDKDGSVNFSRSSYLSIDRNTSLNYTLLIEAPGLCDVFVNDIENDGRLIKGVGYPASRDQFTIAGNSQGSSDPATSKEIEDCSVTYVDDVISAMCSYSGGSSVTGFQIIVQLNNVTEVHKLHINSTTEHLSPGPVTVQVKENGTYHVAIFPIMGETGIVNTAIAYSQVLPLNVDQSTTMPADTEVSSLGVGTVIGVVVALLITTLIVVVVVTVVLIRFRKHNHNMFSEDNIYYFTTEGGRNAINEHTNTTEMSTADPVKPAATESKQEDQVYRQDLGEDDGLRHLNYSFFTLETLQDCGSSATFMSQCGPSQDPSSSMNTTETCLTSHMVIESVKSSHVALKPATNIFNDSNVKLVYLETKSSSDISCSINDYLMGVNVYGETVGEDRHDEKVICKMEQNIQEMPAFWMKNILVK